MSLNSYTTQHQINDRLFALAQQFDAGCDQAFDAFDEDLEREFAELRLLVSDHA